MVGMLPANRSRCTWISTSFSARSPSRSILRNFCAGIAARGLSDQCVQNPFLGRQLGLGVAPPCAGCARLIIPMAMLDEITHDLFDVAADVADLGELGRLDLEERGLGQAGEPPRNLGLADAGRADHQDVLRQHLIAQLLVAAAGAATGCAKRWRPPAWPSSWPMMIAVEFGDDLAGAEIAVIAWSRCSR